jgi:hypothetical protein
MDKNKISIENYLKKNVNPTKIQTAQTKNNRFLSILFQLKCIINYRIVIN